MNVKVEAAESRLYISSTVCLLTDWGEKEDDAWNTFIKPVPLSSGCF